MMRRAVQPRGMLRTTSSAAIEGRLMEQPQNCQMTTNDNESASAKYELRLISN